MAYYGWRPYVTVAERRANAKRELKKLARKGMKIEPVEVEGRQIACTFWGKAWCQHLEQFSDFANRLPRGRTYVRNGSVCHLVISNGKIEAIVSGTELYNLDIRIKPLTKARWKNVRKQCAGQIGSMLELLQGRFSDHVMAIVTDCNKGLFPKPGEIKLSCDCPDWAVMCKHVAAVLYGIGARLDQQPELLFLLRNVDHEELISAELDVQTATTGKGKGRRLGNSQDLSDVFGVEIDDAPAIVRKKTSADKKKSTPAGGKKKVSARKTFTPTPTAVIRLRKRFGMNQSRFAKLLGVSPAAVSRWENGSGKLNLRPHTLKAIVQAARLTPDQAIKKITVLR